MKKRSPDLKFLNAGLAQGQPIETKLSISPSFADAIDRLPPAWRKDTGR